MHITLTYRDPIGEDVAPPAACPHAGCGSGRLRLRQTVAKPVRVIHAARAAHAGHAERAPCVESVARVELAPCLEAAAHAVHARAAGPAVHARPPAAAVAHRYTCLDCGRTFRVYPAGVDRGQVPVGVRHLAAALHLLGLSFRDVSRALTAAGMPLGKSQAQATAATVIGRVRATGIAPLFGGVGVADGAEDGGRAAPGGPAAWIEAAGRKLPLIGVVDERGRPGLAVVGLDWWTAGEIDRWGCALLARIGVEVQIGSDIAAGPNAGRWARRGDGQDTGRGREEAATTADAGAGPAAIAAPDAGIERVPPARPITHAPDAFRVRRRWRSLATRARPGRRMQAVSTRTQWDRGIVAAAGRIPRAGTRPRGRVEGAKRGAAAVVAGMGLCRGAGGALRWPMSRGRCRRHPPCVAGEWLGTATARTS